MGKMHVVVIFYLDGQEYYVDYVTQEVQQHIQEQQIYVMTVERGSNENGNKLLTLFLPKGCNINDYTDDYVMNANELINTKIRKILNYKSSLELFNLELAKLTQA